ncbi:MAG: hypothetical protein KGL38_12560 [Gemmatimonadota bacterium]|nr:hypothetical protein [Gemmatimonadota bacterium]MDE3128835.1 hypothetical protein [Gemmatimonadota bacterium]MDE3174073.1 hypothetical protein [Gemmatimonadota bacterium]MDE3215296.1 hypothetical protein [Gemmatimonadota bacterium]
MRRVSCTAALALLCSATAASAQQGQLARLNTTLDPATRVAVLAIVDSARVARLPADALVNKALEGAGKHADGPRIVAAVRALAGELREARGALGSGSRAEEITAGAHAIHAGVRPADLHMLRQSAVGRELTTPLMVLTDLVARGVPAPIASSDIVMLVRAGLRDSDFTSYEREVRQDIEAGAAPAAAATTRARGATLRRRSGYSLVGPGR